MRQSGPLGKGSPVPQKVANEATQTQATILYQNDEQLKAVWRLEGAVDVGFKGAHERMDKLEGRTGKLEDFNDRIMLLPKSVYWLASMVGLNGFIYAIHWITGSH